MLCYAGWRKLYLVTARQSPVSVICLEEAYLQKALISRGFCYSPLRWQFCDRNYAIMLFGIFTKLKAVLYIVVHSKTSKNGRGERTSWAALCYTRSDLHLVDLLQNYQRHDYSTLAPL